ncbi:hypothetical protein BGZ80_001713 [Entomortierella chlamydospora]|uniref:Uncharacterized protein n=1 Tax=Entomortierella chlamydospora TaxID=101097 RepID=A0A9P6MQF1_9FUNG|nr:hypothetical protein BGZ79_010479 [Entomortierella chlamydospora]KAG0010167.1 hypothetical protein BGZ80_001713 [Entomortierella chlamydospora]
MEPDSQSTSEDETGEDHGHHQNTQLVRSDMGTHRPEFGDDSSNPSSTLSSSGSRRGKARSPIEEPNLVIDGLELKRHRLAADGYDATTIDILTRSEYTIQYLAPLPILTSGILLHLLNALAAAPHVKTSHIMSSFAQQREMSGHKLI